MAAKIAEETGVDDDYTKDGTVDLKGNPILRSKTGRWKACSFIVGTCTLLTHSLFLPLKSVVVSSSSSFRILFLEFYNKESERLEHLTS